MVDCKRLLWFFPAASLFLLFCVTASRGQDVGMFQQSVSGSKAAGGNDASTTESGTVGNALDLFSGGLLPYGLPDPFKGHLVSQYSIGESCDKGLLNGHSQKPVNSCTTFSQGSASFAYDLKRAHSDYLFDYRTSLHRYNQYSSLSVLTHDLSLNQALQLGPRTRWNLNYRYSLNPDFAGSLMGETLSKEMAFLNPVPLAGIRGIPTFSAPFSPPQSPSDGLITLRSIRMTSSASWDLSQELSARTRFSLQAGFHRQRFDDPNLFGSNQYSLSAALTHSLSSRTSVGISYRAGRLDLAQAFQRTIHQGASFDFHRQLSRHVVLSLQGGPSKVTTQAQEAIPLPLLLSNLLGRPSLLRSVAHSSVRWMGSGSLAGNFRFHDVGIGLSYNRSITDSGGLAGASLTDRVALNLGKEFRQITSISVVISYAHFHLLGVPNPMDINQEGFTASVTRKLSRSVDFSTFFIYAKVMNGRPGAALLNHQQIGGVFVFHYPIRVSAPRS